MNPARFGCLQQWKKATMQLTWNPYDDVNPDRPYSERQFMITMVTCDLQVFENGFKRRALMRLGPAAVYQGGQFQGAA
jgi:hypothetical protein